MWESIARTRHNQFEDLGELDNAVDDVMHRKEVKSLMLKKGLLVEARKVVKAMLMVSPRRWEK